MILEEFLISGGYPGSYSLISNPKRFTNYIYDSIMEMVILKDILSYATVRKPIFKWSTTLKSRTSSPKLLPGAPVFTSIFVGRDLTDEQRGRIFEAVVGNRLCETFDNVYYWREGNYELDFVVEHEGQMIGVEVKSKIRKSSSLSFFRAKVPTAKTCIIDMLNYKDFENNPIEFLTQMSV